MLSVIIGNLRSSKPDVSAVSSCTRSETADLCVKPVLIQLSSKKKKKLEKNSAFACQISVLRMKVSKLPEIFCVKVFLKIQVRRLGSE